MLHTIPMAKRQPVPPTAITIEIDGKTYRGSYEIDEDDIITVSSARENLSDNLLVQ